MITHHVTWFVESGEERSYLVSEDEAYHLFQIAIRMGYYTALTPITAYQEGL